MTHVATPDPLDAVPPAGSSPADEVGLDLPALIGGVVDGVRPDTEAAGLRLAVEDHRANRRRWAGPPGPLAIVLGELLENVRRHAYPPGAGGDVAIVLEEARLRGGPAVAVTVHDAGIGMAPRHQAMLLGSRPVAASVESVPGDASAGSSSPRAGDPSLSGIPVIRALVLGALAGTVTVASEPGEGTAVTVLLPLTGPEAADPASPEAVDVSR